MSSVKYKLVYIYGGDGVSFPSQFRFSDGNKIVLRQRKQRNIFPFFSNLPRFSTSFISSHVVYYTFPQNILRLKNRVFRKNSVSITLIFFVDWYKNKWVKLTLFVITFWLLWIAPKELNLLWVIIGLLIAGLVVFRAWQRAKREGKKVYEFHKKR